LGAKAEIRVADAPFCFEVSVRLVKRRAFAQDFVRNAVGTRAGHPLMAVNQYLTKKNKKKRIKPLDGSEPVPDWGGESRVFKK
jgi:hypothetical protein